MDWLGIDRAVVYQSPMDGKQDDYFAQVRQACPDRFCCLAFLDRSAYERPLEAMADAIDRKRLQGFVVNTPNPIPEIAVPRLMPLWLSCAERGLPVVVQNGLPEDVRRLVDAVPDLKVVFSHFCAAGFGPEDSYIQRLEIVASSPNVYTDTGALTHRQRYPFSGARETLLRALERISADDILWGSDYPRPPLVADASYKQQLEFITVECDFLDDDQRARILAGTALEVYPWEQPQ